MPLARHFLTLAIVLLGLGPASAATPIPCRYHAGLIWLKVAAAGKSEPLNFLLDSGAGASVLDLAAARRLGLRLGARQTVQGVEGQCAAFRIDGLAAEVAGIPIPRSMLAPDLRPVSAACGQRIDGLLGMDFFRERIVQIDYAAQKIRLLSRSELPVTGAQILPLVRRNDALCVAVAVDGNAPEWVRLDTGCSAAFEWVVSDAKRQRLNLTSIAAAAGSPRFIHLPVTLGAERCANVTTGLHDRAMFAGESGLLGNGLLARFVVTVDAAQSRLLLSRGP